MTRILFVSWYVGLGGGETDLLTLASHLDPNQYEPHLLLPYDGQLGNHWRDAGWQVHIRGWRGASTFFLPGLWARLPIVGQIETLLQEQKINLIHCDYHTLPMVLPAAKKLQIPVVWTCWGWWFHPKFWQRRFFHQVDQIVARSLAIRDGFLGTPPFIPPEQVPIIYSGINTNRFHPDVDRIPIREEIGISEDTPLVALIARFQDVKGHHIFQEMVRIIASQMPEAQFIVAGENVHGVSGDSAYKRRIMQTHANDPILKERVHYLGFRDDAESVIAAADVVVCPSEFESYGRVNVEAMASTTPVVSSNRGGPSETVVHNQTGYLVAPNDTEALAQHVITLLHNPNLRHEFGTNGRKRVLEHFSAKAMANQYTQIFEKLS